MAAPDLLGRSGRRRRPRRTWAALTAAFFAVLLAASAQGVPVAPTNPDGTLKVRQGSVVEVGPTAEHGFPAWYRDSNGVRLEACTTLDDPLCATLPDEVPNPDAPVSWPDNFPGEFFYQLAGASVTGPGVDMTLALDFEGAFLNGPAVDGEQMVFGRVRVRDKTIADGEYRVTHPYGVDEFVAAGEGINFTEDIGATAGAFGEALGSRIGPFLKWDPSVAPAAPAGYIGDPGVEHQVVGSPYGTNFVSVEKKVDGVWTEIARTDLFSIQGRHATNSGVNADAATYSVGADGTGFVDVYASSDAGQSIEVRDAGLGFIATGLEGDGGHYYGRVATNQTPDGQSVTVANLGDKPVATKTIPLTDVVTITKASYDADADELTVSATSSDQDSTPARLEVMGTPLVNGTATISTVAPRPTVKVTSDKGGSATAPVSAGGAAMDPDVPVAAVFANPTDAAFGQKVTLTGTGSTGTISAYSWRQTGGPAVSISGSDQAVATFFAPATAGTLTFELTVSGPAGTSTPAAVTVNVVEVTPVEPPKADAGPDATAQRGSRVDLDGSGSTLADDYAWTQVSGPDVTLTGATTAKPSFTFPRMPLPTSTTGPNPDYATTSEPVVLRLRITGQGGQESTDEVTITPTKDTLTVQTNEFRPGREWRVAGTSDIVAGQRIAVVLGNDLKGQVLGYTNVETDGTWSFRGAGAVVPGAGTTTTSVVSANGGSLTGATFRRR